MSFTYQDDNTVAGEIEANNTAMAYRSAVTTKQQFLDLLIQYNDTYPDMEPGVLVSLASAGIPTTDPQAQAAAGQDLAHQRDKGLMDRVGDILSPVTHPVKAGLGAVGHAVGIVGNPVGGVVAPVAKGAARVGFVALESGGQELSHALRFGIAETLGDNRGDITGNFNKSGTSSASQVLQHVLRGDAAHIDLGTGILPDQKSQIEKDVTAHNKQLEIHVNGRTLGGPNNPGITLGRTLATAVSEPGTTPFKIVSGLVDAGVSWYGDPSAWLGSAAKTGEVSGRAAGALHALRDEGSLLEAGSRLLTKPTFHEVIDRSVQGRALKSTKGLLNDLTGRVTGDRDTVLPEVVDSFWKKGGRKVAEGIANESSVANLRAATGGKIPVEMLRDLADLRTPDQVINYLSPHFGKEILNAPEYLGYKVKRANGLGFRLGGTVPSRFVDPSNLDDVVDGWDAWARNAKLTPELRNEGIERLARVDGREQIVETFNQIMGKAADEMAVGIKAGPNYVKPVQLASETDAEFAARKVADLERGKKVRARGLTKLFNKDVDATKAYLSNEIAENAKLLGLTVDDEFLKTSSPYIWNEYLNSVIPLPEPREVRRATSTLAKFVDTPGFTGTTDTLDWLTSQWKVMALARPAYTVRVIGEEQIRMAASGLDSFFAHPLSYIAAIVGAPSRRLEALGGPAAIRQHGLAGERFFDEETGLANELELRHAMNKTADNHAGTKVFARQFDLIRQGEDAYPRARVEALGEIFADPILKKIAQADGNLDDVKQWFTIGPGQMFRKRLIGAGREELTDYGAADKFIDTQWSNIQLRTHSDPELLDAVATGRFRGARIGARDANERWKFSNEFENYAATIEGPPVVKGQRIVGDVGERISAMNKAVTHMFNTLMTRPTNYLSRNPTYRQFHWQWAEGAMPFMDDATRAAVLENAAADGGAGASQLARLRKIKSNGANTINDVADADTLARHFALMKTKDLLYDVSERSTFFDVNRILFPFGEAWKEVVTRWAKIGTENPRVLRRGQQLINGARGAGFFTKDTNGEEVFSIPLSGQLSKMAFGVPIPLTGRVAGLSMLGEVMPGTGPVMQISAAALLPETPDWNFARQFVFPFGEQDYSQGVVESMLPGFAKRAVEAFGGGDQRIHNNNVANSMAYLVSTGNYGKSVAEQQRLFHDSNVMARKVGIIRSIGSAFLPTAPLPEYQIKDKNDDLLALRAVVADYHDMQQTPDATHPNRVGFDNADAAFIEKYGPNALLAMQSGTVSISPKLPVTKEASAWRQAHPELVKKYGLTWGLFADTSDGSDQNNMDYTEYLRQIRTGERKALTPEQRYSLAQARVANTIYQAAAKSVSAKPNKAERDQLGLLQEQLKVEFPGYKDLAPYTRANPDKVRAELRRATKDPKLANLPQLQAAALYLAARDNALRYARQQGVQGLGAAASAPAKQWLYAFAQQLLAKYKTFGPMFDRVFASEVEP